MKMLDSLGVPFAILAAALALCGMAPEPQRRGDQQQAFEGRTRGRLLPLPEIERRIVPSMRGAQYIGVDFDPPSAIYTFKFVRDGTVIWVEVDGQTGQIVGRTGR